MKLPHGGRWSRASAKKYSETIVFLHHFGGTRASSKRYREFLNELGYDCVAFNLRGNSAPTWRNPIKELRRIVRDAKVSHLQIWTDNLRDILDLIPGRKIIFSFSSPSWAAAQIIAEEARTDVCAWICDGGPFLDLHECICKYFYYQTHLPKRAVPVAAVFGKLLISGVGFESRLERWMAKFPESVPVLSFRAGMDQLVPADCIDKVFALAPQMRIQKVEIHPARHLEGFKHYPDVYKAALVKFLAECSTPVTVDSRSV